jgi:8-oxo-dGTP pyrophosphatase MutT (NUDIX family)
MTEPKHATLPFWSDKNDDQKMDTLHGMVMDLYQYALADGRKKLLSILENHQSEDEKEKRDVAKITELVLSHPNIFNKNCEPAHLTGSALVVDPKRGAVLLHLHKKLNKWLQFGGHTEYEIDLSEVALREGTEETGISDLRLFPGGTEIIPVDIDMHIISQKDDRPEHYHLDFRYILVTDLPESLHVGEDESNVFNWIPFSEVDAHLHEIDPALVRLIRKAEKLVKA